MSAMPRGMFVRRNESLAFRNAEPEPDLSVVLGERSDFLWEHPKTAALVVEVSERKAQQNREKALIYAEADVEEYWIVLPLEKAVEVYRRPENGRYREMRTYRHGDELNCESVPGVIVDLRSLFARL